MAKSLILSVRLSLPYQRLQPSAFDDVRSDVTKCRSFSAGVKVLALRQLQVRGSDGSNISA